MLTYLVTAPTSHLKQLDKVVPASKSIEQVVLGSLGAGLAVLRKDEIDGSVIVFDIGHAATEVSVFEGGSLAHTVYLPVGSRHVTSDVATLLKTSPEEAERLKTVNGLAAGRHANENETVMVTQVESEQPRPMQRKVLGEIIESRIREIAKMANKELKERGCSLGPTTDMVVTGGGALLPGTDEVIREVFPKQKVRIAHPGIDMGLKDGAFLTTAIGLARFALGSDDSELGSANGSAIKDRIKTLWSLFAPVNVL